MKKLTFMALIALPIVQIVLAALKLLGVIGARWLWVLTPLWLCICGFALYGIYVSLRNNGDRGVHREQTEHEKGNNENEENK